MKYTEIIEKLNRVPFELRLLYVSHQQTTVSVLSNITTLS